MQTTNQTMNVKRLIKSEEDDRGVSPVIGVILMVAITVILAAVIASFVIGLGDSNQDTGPTTTVSFDYDDGAGELDISVTGGEQLDPSNVEVQGSTGSGSPGTVGQSWDVYPSSAKTGPTTELQAGSTLTISVSDDYDISVVYINPNTEESFTLRSNEGPGA